MSDSISRQAAIDVVIKRDANCGIDSAEVLKLLPSVRPRKGKWIRWHETLEDASGVEYMPRCKCSECGKEYEAHSTRFINFCPNCGADMREGEQE